MPFFEKLLPTQGMVCVAQALSKGFRHYFYEDRDEAIKQIESLDAQGHTVYLAQATFKTDENRKQVNAHSLRSFFLDIDCGEGKDYPSQKEAVTALKKMVEDTGLPMPAVMVSGNGLYAYWFLEEEVPAEQWQTIARILKSTLAAYEFNADPSRTSDISSVLRPPGSTHRKDPNNPKAVKLVKDAPAIKFNDFCTALRKAAKAKELNLKPLNKPRKNQDINAEFYAGIDDGPSSSAHIIADKCSQIGNVRTQKGNISEPIWYACLGVLAYTTECDEVTQEWSSGHPDYTPQATQDKVDQLLENTTGPTTCHQLGLVNAQGCLGCKHKDKITSPIVLGRPEPASKVIDVALGEVEPPTGFRRTEEGLGYEEDGRWTTFYDQDLYPARLAFDTSLGYEVITIRHHLPHEGDMEFSIRSSFVNDQKSFLTTFSDNHVKVVGSKEKKLMQAYVEGYAQKLQRAQRMSQLLCQMGWGETRKGDAMFVLGKKIFYHDGTMETATLANNVPSAARGFRSEGSVEKWTEATRVFNKPGMEPLAFALMCGFGAPLMKFTGFEGAMVSMTGGSGTGKTLTSKMLLSIYGNHKELMLAYKDTQNMLISRLGVYGTMPMVIDEVSNIKGDELSDLAYRITQGRDKGRLTKNATEKENLNRWNTLAVVSTNSSLVDRLNSMKQDASAEINRIIEYPVVDHPEFKGEVTDALFWTIHQNFGHAGETYVRWLVQNVQKLGPGIKAVQQKINTLANIRGEERYWSATAAAAIYGGAVAKSLGVIDFDVARMIPWVATMIKNMRDQKDELADTAVGVLGQFLDEHASNRLMIRGDCSPRTQNVPVELPRGPLVIRHEVDNNKLYISRSVLKNWLGKRFGEYTKIANELKDQRVLRNANQRKVLGGNTTLGGAQVSCWVIDLKAPALGAVGLQLLQDSSAMEELQRMEGETNG